MNSSQNAEILLERKKVLALALATRETWLVVVESGVAILLLLAAVLGNTLLCFAVYRTKTLQRKSQNYFIVSLAVTDVLYALLCMLPGLGVLITGKWPFDNVTCQIQGSFALILGAVSLLTMAMIAVNRYFKIVRSTELCQKVFSKRNTLLLIGASWTYALANVLALFFLVRKVYEVRVEKLVCYAMLDNSETVRFMILGGYLFVVAVSLPSVVISYYKVYRKVRAHFAQLMKSTPQDNNARAFANEIRITKMLFVTFVGFIICWSPALVLDLLEATRGQYIFPRQLYLFETFGVQCSSAINPLIYGLLRKEFRNAYKKLLTCGNK